MIGEKNKLITSRSQPNPLLTIAYKLNRLGSGEGISGFTVQWDEDNFFIFSFKKKFDPCLHINISKRQTLRLFSGK